MDDFLGFVEFPIKVKEHIYLPTLRHSNMAAILTPKLLILASRIINELCQGLRLFVSI